MMKILVSACLLGYNTKYNGSSSPSYLLMEYAMRNKFVAVCPETLGGMERPCPPAEIQGGDGNDVLAGTAVVVTKDGVDVTQRFIDGAQKVLDMVKEYGAKIVILKENSPSCGVERIHGGLFDGTRIPGQGVTAALLRQNGVAVYSVETITRPLLNELLED